MPRAKPARSKTGPSPAAQASRAQSAKLARMKAPAKPADIDAYIAAFPKHVQSVLEKVRQTIQRAAPEAQETISYQMPAFRQHGILLFFAAWKEHIGLYPPVSGDPALQQAVASYAGPKGNLQFPLDQPIPYDLIERIARHRASQDAAKAEARKKKSKNASPKKVPPKKTSARKKTAKPARRRRKST